MKKKEEAPTKTTKKEKVVLKKKDPADELAKIKKRVRKWRERAHHWRWQAKSLNDTCELLLKLCEAWRTKYEKERDGELEN